MKTSKLELSPYGDKRYILDDRVSSLEFGHYRIPNADGKTCSFPPHEGEKMDEEKD